MSRTGHLSECRDAMRDVSLTCQHVGAQVEFRIREETDITRDRYNTIKRRQSERIVRVWGMLETTPSEQRREDAGLFEQAELVLWTAAYDWQNNGLDFSMIDIKRTSVIIGGDAFEIQEKGRKSQCLNAFLWYTFGLMRR